MSSLILLGGIAIVLFIAWCIIKRMIYSVFYLAKKAMEDAKNKKE